MAKGDFNTKRLDAGQFELMWNFLRMGYQKCNKRALRAMDEFDFNDPIGIWMG